MKIPLTSGIDLSHRIRELIEIDNIKYENFSPKLETDIEKVKLKVS